MLILPRFRPFQFGAAWVVDRGGPSAPVYPPSHLRARLHPLRPLVASDGGHVAPPAVPCPSYGPFRYAPGLGPLGSVGPGDVPVRPVSSIPSCAQDPNSRRPVIRLMEAVLFGRYPSPGAMCRLTTRAGQMAQGSAFIRPAIKAGSARAHDCHHGAGLPPG